MRHQICQSDEFYKLADGSGLIGCGLEFNHQGLLNCVWLGRGPIQHRTRFVEGAELRIGFDRSCRWCGTKGPFMRTRTKFLVRDYIYNNCDQRFAGLTVLGIRFSWKAAARWLNRSARRQIRSGLRVRVDVDLD